MEKSDKRTEKRKIGDAGENVACRFLMKHGFEIIERNYLKKWGEIDIIAKKGDRLHFIEVKSVTCGDLSYKMRNMSPLFVGGYETDSYRPEDNLHPWKLKRLGRVIQTYLLGCKENRAVSCVTDRINKEIDWQFDVITVYLDIKSMEAKVSYLEDIIL
jgi:Holliday junction resolvase-like predicted endonuclease